MADYTYDQLKEQIETDKQLVEEFKNYTDSTSRVVYSQAKNRLAENQPLLDEYATAYKEKQQQTYNQNVEAFDKQFNEKIENLQKLNEIRAEEIQNIDYMALPYNWSEEQKQQWRAENRQLHEDKISDNNRQIANMKSMVDEKTYIDEEGVRRYKGDNVEVVDLTEADAAYKFDNEREESTQDSLNNAKVNVPKAADTKLDKDAAATVTDDFDVFADANIDSRNLQASYDDPAISKYIEDLNDDVAINHIFSNTFYRIPAAPHWAYSVDFIPTTELLNSIKTINVYTLSQFLTKSVISLTLPAREMTSTVSNYKGLSVELPARAKTSGELSFTFAETESFIISEILEQLLKYARNDMFYEFDSTIVSNYLANTKNADVKQYADNIDMMNSAIAAYRKFIENYAHEFNILVKLYRAADAKALGDTEKNEYPTFVYFFKGCDVASVKQFKFDYNSDKPIDIGASFMYQYFEEMTYEEYLLRYGGWNDGLDDPLLEASQEEMIAAAEASNPLTLVTHRHVYNVNLERS